MPIPGWLPPTAARTPVSASTASIPCSRSGAAKTRWSITSSPDCTSLFNPAERCFAGFEELFCVFESRHGYPNCCNWVKNIVKKFDRSTSAYSRPGSASLRQLLQPVDRPGRRCRSIPLVRRSVTRAVTRERLPVPGGVCLEGESDVYADRLLYLNPFLADLRLRERRQSPTFHRKSWIICRPSKKFRSEPDGESDRTTHPGRN